MKDSPVGALCAVVLMLAACKAPTSPASAPKMAGNPPHYVHPIVPPGREAGERGHESPKQPPCPQPKDLGATRVVQLPHGVTMTMTRVPAGTFWMGTAATETDRWEDERRHSETIPHDFLLAQTPVTQAQWQAVMGENPAHFQNCGADCPVEQVSWQDCQHFVARLNAEVGCGFRLPREAEWEYACRAGQESDVSAADKAARAWFWDNAAQKPHPVATRTANAWGLYDMPGLIWQWCDDRYTPDYAGDTATTRGTTRALRGGSFGDNARSARCAARDSDGAEIRLPIYGCRIAQDL
jgi:formylglycine-generating enzyme required for sulfatase activity